MKEGGGEPNYPVPFLNLPPYPSSLFILKVDNELFNYPFQQQIIYPGIFRMQWRHYMFLFDQILVGDVRLCSDVRFQPVKQTALV